MKFIAAILAWYILFLSVMPGFIPATENATRKEHCKSMKCCRKMKSKDCGKKPGSCPMGMCTPFFGCEKVQVMLPSQSSFTLLVIDQEKKKYRLDDQFLIDGVSSDFWHPPRVI